MAVQQVTHITQDIEGKNRPYAGPQFPMFRLSHGPVALEFAVQQVGQMGQLLSYIRRCVAPRGEEISPATDALHEVGHIMVEQALKGIAALHGAEVMQHHSDELMRLHHQGAGDDFELSALAMVPVAQGEEALRAHRHAGLLGLQNGEHGPAMGAGMTGAAAARALAHVGAAEELTGTAAQRRPVLRVHHLENPVIGGQHLPVDIQDQHQTVQCLHQEVRHRMAEKSLGLQLKLFLSGAFSGGEIGGCRSSLARRFFEHDADSPGVGPISFYQAYRVFSGPDELVLRGTAYARSREASMDLGIRGKVAMVAAGSKGLGRAAALALAAEGCAVSVCGRTAEALASVKAELEGFGVAVVTVSADVSKAEDLVRWHQITESTLGPVDILITNTGGPKAATFDHLSDEDWAAGVETTLMNVVRMSRLVLPGMRARQWGRIVHITSLVAKQPYPLLTISSTLRAGLSGLTRTLALETAKDGITVNALLPGHVMTDRQTHLAEVKSKTEGITVTEHFARQAAAIPAGRIGTPEEIGAVIAFLCSASASYLTGQSLLVDGGLVQGTF